MAAVFNAGNPQHPWATTARTTPLASATASSAPIEIFPPIVDPDIEANRLDIEELQIGHAPLDDKINKLGEEMKNGFKRLESLIAASAADKNASVFPSPSTSEAYH